MNSYQSGVIASTMTPIVLEPAPSPPTSPPDMRAGSSVHGHSAACHAEQGETVSDGLVLLLLVLSLAIWYRVRRAT